MLNYTPLTQVRIKKKRLKLEGWQIGVLIFFVSIASIALVLYGIVNYQENMRLQKEAQRIAQAAPPPSQITPTPKPIEYSNVLEAFRQEIANNNYKITLYNSLPLDYLLTTEEATKAALLKLPTTATYTDAVELYSMRGTLLKFQKTKQGATQTLIINTASQSANFVDVAKKSYVPIEKNGPNAQWWNLVTKIIEFQSPLWILSQANGPYAKQENGTWQAAYKDAVIVVTVSQKTGLPMRVELQKNNKTLGAINMDVRRIDDSTAFTIIPDRYTAIPLKEATQSGKKKSAR